MNIFILDEDPKKCAQYHNDKHVVKMILETAQLLCGVHHMVDSKPELCRYRYEKRHKSQDIIEWCIINHPPLKEIGKLTPFRLAMPEECKIGSAVESYREYYIKEKKHFSKWKNREIPNFMKKCLAV